MMMSNKAATQEHAVARTSVLWDIDTSPVPRGCDAHRIGPSIKRALNSLGYNGPLTITALGKLTDVPDHVLRALSSSGIALNIIPCGGASIMVDMLVWSYRTPTPCNFMLISGGSHKDAYSQHLGTIGLRGHNVIQPDCLWEGILKDAMDSGETSRQELQEKTDDSPCSFVCKVCDVAGQSFEDFTTHFKSEEHSQRMLPFLPLDSHPKNGSTMVRKQPKEKLQEEEDLNKTKEKSTYMAHGVLLFFSKSFHLLNGFFYF